MDLAPALGDDSPVPDACILLQPDERRKRARDSIRCAPGETCFGCECLTGSLLGALSFSVVPGPSATNPPDDGQSTWLGVAPAVAGIQNGTQGDFNPGPLLLAGGFPDASGRAQLFLVGTTHLGADVPVVAGQGRACVRLVQDPQSPGEIDCDGGSNYDVSLSVDSQGTGPNGSPTLTVGGGPTDAGPGVAIIRVLAIQR